MRTNTVVSVRNTVNALWPSRLRTYFTSAFDGREAAALPD
jgi:hypothetical protein